MPPCVPSNSAHAVQPQARVIRKTVLDCTCIQVVANLPPSQDANLPVDSDSDSEDAGGGSPSVTGIDPEESDSAG